MVMKGMKKKALKNCQSYMDKKMKIGQESMLMNIEGKTLEII